MWVVLSVSHHVQGLCVSATVMDLMRRFHFMGLNYEKMCVVHILQDAHCYSRLVHLVICLGTNWSTLQWSIEPFHCPVLERTFPHIFRRLTSLINGTHTTQLPPVSHILLSVKIKHNWPVLTLTAADWEGPGYIWALTLALIQFVRLLLTHSCLCKIVSTLGVWMLKQLHSDLLASVCRHCLGIMG